MPASRWSRSPAVILGSLTTLNALNYLDRYVSAATLPLILADLAISDAQGGLLQSLFIVAYSLACGPAGWLGDSGSRLRLVSIGVFVWSVATVASGLAPTYAWLLIARAVIGIGEAGYAVVTPSILSDCYPAGRRARVLGIFYAAIPIGSALGYIVGGLVGEAYGWRAAFFVAGAPGAALAFLLLLLTEPARGAQDATHGAATPLGLGPSLRALVSRRSYVVNTASQIIYTFSMGGLATWMPTYFVRERGFRSGARRRRSACSWWSPGSPAPCSAGACPPRSRGATRTPISSCRAGPSWPPSSSRSSRCWHRSLPCSGPPCSSPCSWSS